MAKQIEGVYERIVECAKKEFLANGYKDASLRVIAANAGTTTGSIYTRFKDKEGLFRAIVESVVDGMREIFLNVQETFHQLEPQKQETIMSQYIADNIDRLLDYIYDHFEEFQLLLDASYGTRYQNFVDELAQIEVDYTYKYMEVIGCGSIVSGVVTEDFLHIVTTAYFDSMFEIVRHDMDKDSAKKYLHMLQKYHEAGFDTIFWPDKYL